jgi:hypothetical protein
LRRTIIGENACSQVSSSIPYFWKNASRRLAGEFSNLLLQSAEAQFSVGTVAWQYFK